MTEKDDRLLPRAGECLRALVVDDSASQRHLLVSLLEAMDIEVLTASNAAEGLFLCMTEDPPIRLILSDWQMPEMDGPEFCRTLRELAQQTYTYFVLMTSETDRAFKTSGLEAGADDFVTRPIDIAELRARINTARRLLEMQEKLLQRNQEVRATLDELRTMHEAVNRDLAEARKLQRAFLPAPTYRMGGSELSLRLVTSGQIGGDLVGYFPISDTRIALYSIDVSGHGIASALLTGRLAGLFTYASRRGNIAFRSDGTGAHSPEVVMRRLNEIMLRELVSDIYFTGVLAYVDTETGEVEFCQAGHPHPLIRRADGRVDRLGEGGPPVGLLPEVSFDRVTARLAPGDALLAYSDGLTDCTDTRGDMLAEEGLMALLAGIDGAPEAAVDGIEAALHDHAGINQFEDDISMLLFRYDLPTRVEAAA
ncbi:fused response regulator/phosphatase [uncultured Jannaschia sp.]|uniref:PP2C family protein-serine/threonine phosphatase n=1 Tax=uncultured Jannaschia sp. TaxID=293347 RepID=UPI0026115D76|nr:fused response regulator/phosphatase [uncultured Jannaschia sp.]